MGDVCQFGAVGDGKTLNTTFIQAAIDACSAAGGGTVCFPAGRYLSGTLHLRSNVVIELGMGAVLLASTDIGHYSTDTHKQRYANESHMDRCFIYGEDAENISIVGPGAIDGQGSYFPNAGYNQRPMLLRLLGCRNVRLQNLALRSPAAWTTAFILCDTVYAEGLDIVSRVNSNGDGLDFDSCQNVFVSNCKFDTSDDSICLQNAERNHPCKNVVITNCIMKSRWAAVRIGLLSSGDIEDVVISNCVFHDLACSGLKIQSTEGGAIRNMLFENIVMRNVARPIFLTFNHFRMGVDAPKTPPATGGICNLQFNNLRVTNETPQGLQSCAILVDGTPGHYIENISISNFDYEEHWSRPRPNQPIVPGIVNRRPEAFVYEQGLPAYGLYARHVRDLRLRNVRLRAPQAKLDDIFLEDVIGYSVG